MKCLPDEIDPFTNLNVVKHSSEQRFTRLLEVITCNWTNCTLSHTPHGSTFKTTPGRLRDMLSYSSRHDWLQKS